MLAYKNVMLIYSRRHSRAFLTDILQAKAIAIRETCAIRMINYDLVSHAYSASLL